MPGTFGSQAIYLHLSNIFRIYLWLSLRVIFAFVIISVVHFLIV